MIDAPTLTTTQTQRAATIHLVTPRTEVAQHMDPAIREVLAALAAQGLSPSGPMFSLHHRLPSDTFDFEVGFPVAFAVTATGRVKESSLPASRVARTVYRGPYEGLGAAWGEFKAWVAKQPGLQSAPGLWERYLVGPEAGPDAAGFQTELNQPLED